MKKALLLMILVLLCLPLAFAAVAEEAQDITGRCEFIAAPASQGRKADMQDHSYLTHYT